MVNLTRLRILIVITWLIFIVQGLSLRFYDPGLYALMQGVARITLDTVLNVHFIFNMVLLIEIFFMIYASAALWFCHITGKWAYVIAILLALLGNYFIPVRAFNPMGIFLEDFSYLVAGVILTGLFSSPLKEQLAEKKKFPFWSFFTMFLLFFLIFFVSRYVLFMY